MITPFSSFTKAHDAACVPLPEATPEQVCFSNISEIALRSLGRKYLKTMPENQKILLHTHVQRWELTADGKASKEATISSFVQSKQLGQFKTERLSLMEQRSVFLREFSTSNIPEKERSNSFRGAEVLKIIKSAIFKTAPRLQHPEKYEWRLDTANYSEDELNEIIARLSERGFVVSTILPPQIKLEDTLRRVRLNSTQYLCIALPPLSDQLEPSDKNFSAFQLYQTCKRVDIKETFTPRTQSVDYVLRGINAELQTIAKESSLCTSYPIDVACLRPDDQAELISRLRAAGYKVYIGREKRYFQIGAMEGLIQYTQEILIDLSSNRAED